MPIWAGVLIVLLAAIGVVAILKTILGWLVEQGQMIEFEEEAERAWRRGIHGRIDHLRDDHIDLTVRLWKLSKELEELKNDRRVDCGCVAEQPRTGHGNVGGGVREEGQGGVSDAAV